MKTHLILLICLLTIELNGQFIEPDFIFTLIGEDAQGNRDTVKVVYHKNSLSICDWRTELDPRFDNEDISDLKWNKSFEMRMMNTLQHSDVSIAKSSKNIIVPYSEYEPEFCVTKSYKQIMNMEYAQLYIKCKFPPYKIVWDTLLFKNNACA